MIEMCIDCHKEEENTAIEASLRVILLRVCLERVLVVHVFPKNERKKTCLDGIFRVNQQGSNSKLILVEKPTPALVLVPGQV